MSPAPLGAISAGIRYQTRFFWRHAFAMLAPKSIVSRVVMEHRGVKAVDDVVVFYEPPGINDRGVRVEVDFHQIKFHVAKTGTVDHRALLDPEWTGTKHAILPRLAEEWKKIRSEYPNARMSLVTNWPWSPQCPIGPLIRDGGRIADEFFKKGQKSEVGKIRLEWQAACGLPDGEFETFARALRFSTSALSQDDAEEWLRDRCQLAGLVPTSSDTENNPYDDLGNRLIETGRTEHTPESLRALMNSEGLIASDDSPFNSTFAVRSFSRFAHIPETDGACIVDLTDLFNGRSAVSEDHWSVIIPQRLDAAVEAVCRLDEPVHVALDAHLSIAWYTGCLLNTKLGKRIVLRQRIKAAGVETWDVSVPHRPNGAAGWTVTREEHPGSEVALIISVTHSARTDATRFIRDSLRSVGTIIHAELLTLGQRAVQDGPHARWLADELVRMATPMIAELRPAHVHLFLACPASIAFLLGQEAYALGPTTTYEYQFGDPTRHYRPGMTTPTEFPL